MTTTTSNTTYRPENLKKRRRHRPPQLAGTGRVDANGEGECPPAVVEWEFPGAEDGSGREKQPQESKSPEEKTRDKSHVIERFTGSRAQRVRLGEDSPGHVSENLDPVTMSEERWNALAR